MKLLSIAVPCYNSAPYMRNCIDSLLTGGDRVEILIIDDGSTKDNTLAIAREYEAKYPGIVKAIHQENGGHGEAVNTGLKNATGVYFKVVDSDDHLDTELFPQVLDKLEEFVYGPEKIDMLCCNFVYDKQGVEHKKVMAYHTAFPKDTPFTWDQVRFFMLGQYILMHSVIYRTAVLRASGMELPKHTFYVDNLFVYQPLPQVKTIYYLNLDLYRYFIGRDDQSVNEKNMIKRVDQQLRVTRLMMEAVDVFALPPEQDKLRAYMLNYFSMMMAISSIFLALDGSEEALAKRKKLWDDLKAHDERLYRRCRHSVAQACNLPGWLGCKLSIGGYRIAQKLFKFN